MNQPKHLTYQEHRRDNLARTYIYSVVSRRARGLSLGVNLSTTNRCNFRCIYCQVPELSRGGTPAADLALLQRELDESLDTITTTDYMQQHVPEGLRRLNDIAFSGNGEPTSCPNLESAIEIAGQALQDRGLRDVNLIIITNGSYLGRARTHAVLEALAGYSGEIWAKLDGGTADDIERINDLKMPLEQHLQHIAEASRLVRTRIQSCFIHLPDFDRQRANRDYLLALQRLLELDAQIEEVQVYTMARPSHQSDAPWALTNEEVDQIADQIEALGLPVSRAYAS